MDFPYLIILNSSRDRLFPLLGNRSWTIGRGRNNDLIFSKDEWVSGNHALLLKGDGEFYSLVDVGSKNGTFVNGDRVDIPVILQPGDRIKVGKTTLIFYWNQNHLFEFNSQARIPQENVTEIFDMAAKLSLQNDNSFALKDLVAAGVEAGIPAKYMYRAIAKVDNKKRLSFQAKSDRRQNMHANNNYFFQLLGTWFGLILTFWILKYYQLIQVDIQWLILFPILGLILGIIVNFCYQNKFKITKIVRIFKRYF